MAADEEGSGEDEDIYSEEDRDEMAEDDEIEPWEEGFMEGEDMEGQQGKCGNCGDILTEKCVEEKLDGKTIRFCSPHCADKYIEKHSD